MDRTRKLAFGRKPQGSEPLNRFTMKMQKKLVLLFFLMLALFVVLIARLVLITREKGETYSRQVLSQQRYESTTLPFRRGDILDTKGTVLATSEKTYNLILDSNLILSKEKYLEPTLHALAECFGMDVAQTREYIRAHPDSSYYIPLKQLTYEQISPFQDMQREDSGIQGIFFEEEYKRVYPNGSLACDVVGFTNGDNTGTYGLEEFYNDMLNGTTGREYGYLNSDRSLERTVKPAVDGYTLHSTIDANIQSIVEKCLKQFQDEHADAAREGDGANQLNCIIMEVNTGNILAMASYPTFDLNNPRDISAYYTEDELAAMDEQTYYDTLNQLWRNYCISDTFEPGSVAKPFTVAAGLEIGRITGNEVYQCDGYLTIGGHDIHCHNIYGDGAVTVQDAIAWSCNVALMKISEAIGANEFSRLQAVYNFGLKTNIDLAGEARTAGLLFTAESMKAADLATNSFGQNFNVTMIQMISGFCSLVNGGYYYEPHVVDKITNASGATVQNIEPRVLKQTISEATSRRIRQYCRAVVMEEGGQRRTGKTARPAGYAIGGKTGTAETLPRGNGEYVVSFLGYAPADDPQLAIYVVVDRPNALKQDDAKFATGIVRNILTEVLPYQGIFMTEELSEAEIQELEQKQLEIITQYAEETQDDGEAGDGSQNGGSGAESGDSEGGSESGDSGQPRWLSFAKDPDTGYLVDPDTGELLDPDTGDLIGRDFPAISD
ncbi:MAG: penicillin-binding protein 2 [Clostridium sp.]|jgi:stage V sporulation protein D (sporulation-specific penicillin-binding protein)|nr:penicillin-binding protein 2 [Clostridium sp.]